MSETTTEKLAPVERRGLDLLLANLPEATVEAIERNESWLLVRLDTGRGTLRFAIWRHTGAVYTMSGGAVSDDPIITVGP